MSFYLTHSSNIKNILSILKTGKLKPSGGQGILSKTNTKKYLYFELVFSKLKRTAPGLGIYFDYNMLKDFDFYYHDTWKYINNDTEMGTKFPKKGILKKLKLLRSKYLKKIRKGIYPIYGYQFVTKRTINISKYIKFVSNPKFGYIYEHSILKPKSKNKKDEEKIIKLLNKDYPDAKILNKWDKLTLVNNNLN